MAHPEWVLKHKIPNTEIRNIRGRYYLYSITSVWCPEKKRTKKKTLKQLGVIDQEHGLIPTGMSRKGKVPKGASKMRDDIPLETNFSDKFEAIKDSRSEKNKLFTLSEILLVTVMAVICGAEGWKDVENYGKAKINYLRRYFNYRNGTPSDDTIRRFFRSLDPDNFKKIFCDWIHSVADVVNAKVIAVDGKSSRRSHDDGENMLHVVNAFSAETRIVLGQEKVANKSNEITAIPKLLELIDVKGHIVTIDAMGCQYAIADQILEKEGDYIFSLKGNHGNLSDDVKMFFISPKKKSDIFSCVDYDKGHGRLETRECFVCHDVQWLKDIHPQWKSVNSIIKINSTREFREEERKTNDTRYYISSLKNPTPQSALLAVRQHWEIENSLHWILDMSFNEDYSRIRKENAPHVMTIIRHIALNLLQNSKPKRQSIKGMRKICSWDNDTLTHILAKQGPLN